MSSTTDSDRRQIRIVLAVQQRRDDNDVNSCRRRRRRAVGRGFEPSRIDLVGDEVREAGFADDVTRRR